MTKTATFTLSVTIPLADPIDYDGCEESGDDEPVRSWEAAAQWELEQLVISHSADVQWDAIGRPEFNFEPAQEPFTVEE